MENEPTRGNRPSNPRRRSRDKVKIFKEAYLPFIMAAIAVIVIVGIVIAISTGWKSPDPTINPTAGSTSSSMEAEAFIEEIIANDITMEEFDKVQLNPVIKPDNVIDKTLEYSSSNPEIVDVSNTGEVFAKAKGDAVISIRSFYNTNIVISINVSVIDTTFEKTNYKVLDNIIYGINDKTEINQFKNKFKNINIKVYDSAGKEKASGYIATQDKIIKMKNNLFKNYYVVVKGDTTGDGKVNINDLILIRKHLAGISNLSDYKLLAADINGDGKVNINDAIRIRKFLAGLGDL